MRRLGSLVEREPEGTWIIAPNHLERAADFERTRARAAPMIVETLSALPLDKQVAADGATWLDRELVADEPEPMRDTGFGREVRQALARRRQWLIEQQPDRQAADRVVYRANTPGHLPRRERTRVSRTRPGEPTLNYATGALPGKSALRGRG